MEVQDAYQEYVKTRREEADADPLVTVELPVTELASIYRVIYDSVEESKDNLSQEVKTKWANILRKLARSVEGVL